jgi:integrase
MPGRPGQPLVEVPHRHSALERQAEPVLGRVYALLTREQLARVLAALPSDDWRLLFEVLAVMGLRISEALGLDWEHVEFGARPELHVRQQYYRGQLKRLKTDNGRRDLPLPPALAQKLREHAVRQGRPSGPVFRTRTGSRLIDRNVTRALDRATGRTALRDAERDKRRPPRKAPRME